MFSHPLSRLGIHIQSLNTELRSALLMPQNRSPMFILLTQNNGGLVAVCFIWSDPVIDPLKIGHVMIKYNGEIKI